jgi:hypothetical protein
MSDNKINRRSTYVDRAAEETQRLLRDLIVEKEKLMLLTAAVQRENERLQLQLRLSAQQLEQQRLEHEQLRRQLSEIERESRTYADQFAEVEQRNMNLANLYVSSYQLHGTLDRSAVLDSIREIVINLIGSEELGVFERADDGSFELVTSFGIDEDAYRSLSSDDAIGRLASSGETYIGSSAPAETVPPITACLPLKLDGEVTGAIVLFSLLPHKPGLQELDFELFDLLGTHAATALYCTRLRLRIAAGAAA